MRGLVLGLVATGVLAASAMPAQAQCQALWVERNSIYKAYGYCFKTDRARDYFGNRGCQYNYEGDIPLSGRDRARIARILAEERSYGCR